jgi:hypothetical protein
MTLIVTEGSSGSAVYSAAEPAVFEG